MNTRVCKVLRNGEMIEVESFSDLSVGEKFKLYEPTGEQVGNGFFTVEELSSVDRDGNESIVCRTEPTK